MGAYAHAAGQGGGADLAIHEKRESSLDGPLVNKSCKASDFCDAQQLLAAGELENLLQIVPVIWVFHLLTSSRNGSTATHLCMAAFLAHSQTLALSLLLVWLLTVWGLRPRRLAHIKSHRYMEKASA